MPKVLPVAIALFVALTSSLVFGQSLRESDELPDDVFYTYLFYRLGNSQTNASLIEEVKSGALLTDKQSQTLKTLIADYSSAVPNLSKKEKLRLALSSRGKLKAYFGVNKFKAFDDFAKARFAGEIVYFSNAPSAFLGSVSISIIESTHTLQGQAGIVFNDSFEANLNAACSVNAVMSGPNVSQSGSMSGDCEVANAFGKFVGILALVI